MLIIGHRGAAGLAPENTLASFEAAIEADVDMIEFDVRVTRDGHPVVIHDSRLIRTHHSARSISSLTLEELQTATSETPIPTLREVLDRYFGKVLLNIEVKGRDTAMHVFEIIKKYYIHHTADWNAVLISSIRANELIVLRRTSTRINLALVQRNNPFLFVAYARRLQLTAVVFHRLHLNAFALEIAKRSGLFTAVYTVNRPHTAKALARLGYDAVFTDYPDKIGAALQQSGS